ncbi:MAG: peptidase [Bacteroidales bacterium]|nr:peptidase [Bacteroidales bacterium]
MRLQVLFVALAALMAAGCANKTMTLEERLATLPADTLFRINADSAFSEAWEIRLLQPVDHRNPDGPKFTQQVFLYYAGADRPVVVETEGYGARGGSNELASLMQANLIRIEHRYFEESKPDSTAGWEYLNTWQAATDHHRIIDFFKPVFSGKWATTGISKGGQTVMFHRYYYPEDVDVSVPYVAPLNFGPEDERMFTFLEQVGSKECRDRVFRFQKLALEKFDNLFPLFQKMAEERSWTFNRVGGPEVAYEMTVLEYEFAFWQWGTIPCDSIALEGSDEKLFRHLAAIGDPSYFADQGLAYFEPFFYQAMTEIGYYGYDFDKFGDLLKHARNGEMPEFIFSAPQGEQYVYNYDIGREVSDFISTDAENFIFLYGEYDPWSATAADPGENDRCLKVVRQGGSHRTRIMNLPDDQKEVVLTTLEKWLDFPASR